MDNTIAFVGVSQTTAEYFRSGGFDHYGQRPEHARSNGDAPCRCCLRPIPLGSAMLVVAFRPFLTVQPYAETGPIFICASDCVAAPQIGKRPGSLNAPMYVMRGYSTDERIVSGSGQVVPRLDIPEVASSMLRDPEITFVDIRSTVQNCWQCRVVSKQQPAVDQSVQPLRFFH